MDSEVALALAIDAANFINKQGDGALWHRTNEPDSSIDLTLYHGASGIALFLLELSRASGQECYYDRAIGAGRLIAAKVLAKERSSVAFATGWPGYAFSLGALSDHANEESDRALFRNASNHALRTLMTQATDMTDTTKDGDRPSVGWIEPMPFSDITGHSGDREIYDLSVGAAGAGVGLLDAHTRGLGTDALESAVLVAERLLQVGEPTPDGLRWGLMNDVPFPFTAPNLAHGGAGVGYFLALLFEKTGDKRYLEAAISTGRYAMSRATPVGNGCLVCHTEEQQPPAFYLGACHGPAGTGRLLALLSRLTGESEWGAATNKLFDGLRGLGAPATRSWGWWNNYSQCCGDAGLGDYALSMWSATNDSKYLELAHECAAVIGEKAVHSDHELHTTSIESTAQWPQAEHRTRPKFVQSQTGYMQGAAGIGSFLVHLATAETTNPVRILFPDEHI